MSELLNLLGLSSGVVLYAMLLAMVVGAYRGAARTALDPLLVATAVLGLVWNLCALALYERPRLGGTGLAPWLATIGFAALGFLPSVVVHSVLRGEPRPMRAITWWVIGIAYAVGAVAAILHVADAVRGLPVPSAVGMRMLTYTFVAAVVPLAFLTRAQPGGRRALWVAALAAFAVSALHLSQLHRGDASWPIELLGHHASVPLALAILYQDYPFALADLFLKRALSLLGFVSIAFLAVATFGAHAASAHDLVRIDAGEFGILVSLWVATALAAPAIRRASSWFVDTVVLRRPDFHELRATVAGLVHQHDSIPELLSEVCGRLAPALNARSVTWHELPGDAGVPVLRQKGTAAVVLVPTVEAPRYAIAIAALAGGRRFLSDDADALDAIGISVGRRIDAIRLTRERYERELREQQAAKLAAEAELRALRAQLNPHFLFNALTTIAQLVDEAPARARGTILRLTSLLRGVLRSEGEYTTLGRELEIIESYLEIEEARFEQRLRVCVAVPDELRGVRVPPLVLQPLVENAVKHGIAPREEGGEVVVSSHLQQTATGAGELVMTVRDSGAGATPLELAHGRTRGVGLQNVERRLAHQYGGAASLTVASTPGHGTMVTVVVPVVPAGAPTTTSPVR